MEATANRRLHQRYTLPAMYAPVAVRLVTEDHFTHHGHVYDISEGGLRFELDSRIEPGTPVAVQVTLPGLAGPGDSTPVRSVFAFANIVWLQDEDEPGPVRMAAVFSRFARAGDRERLLRQLDSGRFARAA